MKPRSPLAAPRSIETLTPPEGGPPSQSMERPVSVLGMRGVKITEVKDLNINPNPVMLEESDCLLEEYLSPRKLVKMAIIDDDSLRDLTGQDNLEEVVYLEMHVNTQDTSLGNFGAHLPNLMELKLSNSIITSVRDLGSSLRCLSVLWMARCGLEDLGGLSTMNSLTELYLAFNEISDIGPCSMLEKLQILDLEGNNIDELAQIEFLSLCSSLNSITLDGNPVCVTPSPDQAVPDYDYRDSVHKLLPKIRLLDDEPLTDRRTAPKVSPAQPSVCAFDDDWKFLEKVMADSKLASVFQEEEEEVTLPIPGSSGGAECPVTGFRPGSALKQNVPARPFSGRTRSAESRPLSARPLSSRPGSARPTTASKEQEEEVDFNDTSELTTGKVVCGNLSKALRSRSQGNSPLTSAAPTTPKFSTHNIKRKKDVSKPAPTLPQEKHLPSTDADEPLKEEILKWRNYHQKMQSAILASKQAQVLTISHDDTQTTSLSDSNDDELTDNDDKPYDLEPHQTPTPESGARPRSSRTTKNSSKGVNTRGLHAVGSQRSDVTTNRSVNHDESYDVTASSISPLKADDSLSESLNTRLSFNKPQAVKSAERISSANGLRPRSGKIRLEPMTTQPKLPAQITNSKPDSPDNVTPQRSTLTPPGQTGRMRRAQLANVPLLPSKFK